MTKLFTLTTTKYPQLIPEKSQSSTVRRVTDVTLCEGGERLKQKLIKTQGGGTLVSGEEKIENSEN